MKIVSLAAFIAALALPIAASAQVVQQPPVQPQGQYNQRQNDQAATQYKRWTKRLAGLNLSSQQQQQVQRLLDQFGAQHPAGSPRDRAGVHALRDQIFAVLSPAQQAQLRQQMEAAKAAHMQRQEQGQPQPVQQQLQPPMQPQQVQPAPPL